MSKFRFAGVAVAVLVLTWAVLRGQHAEEAPPITDQPLPAIKLKNLNGEWKTWENWKSHVLVASFWATWCGPCVVELPSLQRLAEHFKGQPFAVIGINTEGKRAQEKVMAFVKRTNLQFPILLDLEGEAVRAFQVSGLPRNLIINKKGEVVFDEVGDRRWDHPEMIARIEGLLKQP